MTLEATLVLSGTLYAMGILAMLLRQRSAFGYMNPKVALAWTLLVMPPLQEER